MTPSLANTGDPTTLAARQALKADIAANATVLNLPSGPTAIKDITNPDNFQDVADWYNQLAAPNWFVIRTDVPVADILNAIVWANFTPSPAITSGNAAQATAASAYCQGKMLNLQTMLFGRTAFDATKATQTGGLKDATTQLPSGAAFANQPGGWGANAASGVWSLCTRKATNAEKVFAGAGTVGAVPTLQDTGPPAAGAQGNPALMSEQGLLTAAEIAAAKAS